MSNVTAIADHSKRKGKAKPQAESQALTPTAVLSRPWDNAGLAPEGFDFMSLLSEGWTPDAFAGFVSKHSDDLLSPAIDPEWPFWRRSDGWIESRKIEDTDDGPVLVRRKHFKGLDVIGLADSARSNDKSLLLRVTGTGGVEHTKLVSKSIITDKREFPKLVAQLTAHGLELASRYEDDALWRFIDKHPCAEEVTPALFGDEAPFCIARKTGWQDDGRFVLPDTAFPAGGAPVFYEGSDKSPPPYAVSGTLAEWKDAIAAHGPGNPLLGFVLSVAFVGPLLAHVGETGFGYHLFGHSSRGKTTALKLAGSVWGGGSRGYIRSWRTTDNALEAVAEAHSGALLALDEIGQADPSAVAHAAYALANGEGKSRANVDGSARMVRSWRTVFLSTGEVDIKTALAEGGKREHAGHTVRVIGVPFGEGIVAKRPAEFPDDRAFVAHLNEAAARFYGSASREFLSKLSADPNGVARRARQAAEGFALANIPRGADAQVERVAKAFGLVVAAGELAVTFGVLPWKEGEASAIVASIFANWVAARGGVGSHELAEGMRKVRDFITRNGDTQFKAWDDASTAGLAGCESTGRDTRDMVGFRRIEGGEATYYVFANQWAYVCKGFNPSRIAAALAEAGVLPSAKSTGERLPGYRNPMKVYKVAASIVDVIE